MAGKSENKTETATVSEKTATVAKNATVYNINAKGFKIVCKSCGKQAIKKSPQAKFCGNDCKNDYHNSRKPETQTALEL